MRLAAGLLKHLRLLSVSTDSVFAASYLTLETKRMVYQSVVLGVLLYGAESWAPTQ